MINLQVSLLSPRIPILAMVRPVTVSSMSVTLIVIIVLLLIGILFLLTIFLRSMWRSRTFLRKVSYSALKMIRERESVLNFGSTVLARGDVEGDVAVVKGDV